MFSLQSRGAGFSLKEDHLNTLEPGEKTFSYHYSCTCFKRGTTLFFLRSNGCRHEPQGQVQVLVNHLEYGMNIQEAGEAPRFRHFEDGLALESGIAKQTKLTLMEMGHKVIAGLDVFGGYQGILIDPETNMLQGGSDPRKDGCAIGY